MNPVRLFTDHPSSVGETYGQHFHVACRFGLAMIAGGMACMVHAALPFMFTTRGSATVARLYERMVSHRAHPPDGRPATRNIDAAR